MNLSVTIPPVRTFPNVEPSKAQALKPLEEAAEVLGAWKQVCECFDDCDSCGHATYRGCVHIGDLVDECCDVITATCNLLAALGVDDLTEAMAACERRNERRGRYGHE